MPHAARAMPCLIGAVLIWIRCTVIENKRRYAMQRFKGWFNNLTRVGRASFWGAIALGGLIGASAMSPTEPQDTVQNTVSPVQQRTVKLEPVVTTKVQTETETIPYSQQTIEDDSLAKGSTVVRVAGVEGVKTVTHTITYADGIETDRTTS